MNSVPSYDGRLFRAVHNSDTGEVSRETIFRYKQRGDLVSGEYSGGDIEYGQLIGLVDEKGQIEMRYHHLNIYGDFRSGQCNSKPEWLENGKIRLHEKWQWAEGVREKGTSLLEEI